MTISSLIDRLKAGSGADRELDAAIIVATTPTISTDDDLIYLSEIRKDDHCTSALLIALLTALRAKEAHTNDQ